MKRICKYISIIMILLIITTTITTVITSAKDYSLSLATTNSILNSIKNNYSENLSDKISDLFYDSDYSDFISNKTTFRNYYNNGNKKSWPISNADSYGTSVIDRGNKVNWGWGSAGCMSYACFFSYSVYGTIGLSAEKINAGDANAVKDYLEKNAQPGEHIRIDGKHSIVFLSFAKDNNGNDGFYFCEYWGGGDYSADTKTWSFSKDNDQYYIGFFSFNNFAIKYSGRKVFIYNAYESSKFANNTDDDSNVKTITRDLVLVLDTSGSMSGSKLSNTKKAAISFVDTILSNTTQTQIAVVEYADNAATVIGLTKDKKLLTDSINAMYAKNMTNMYAGMTLASSILDAGSAKKKGMVVFTDGAANEGYYTSSGNRTGLDGNDFYVTSYGAPIFDLAKNYKENKGYSIYSFGFGLSTNSDAYNLLKNICNDNDKFVSVTSNNLNDLMKGFKDIFDETTQNKKINISFDCPIEVTIDLNGETITSEGKTGVIKGSFGQLVATDDFDGRHITAELDYNEEYEITISGTDDGDMSCKVEYEVGDTTTFREFSNIPVNKNTVITTSKLDNRADLAMYVDENGDNEIDFGWSASMNETVTAENADIIEQIRPTEVAYIGDAIPTSTSEPTMKLSRNNINIDLKNDSVGYAKLYVNTNGNSELKLVYDISNENISAKFDAYSLSKGYFPITITAKNAGQSTITIKLYNNQKTVLYATEILNVSVSKSRTIEWALNYKSTNTFTISDFEPVSYTSNDTNIVKINSDGSIYGAKRGNATVIAYDSDGNTRTIKVIVKYAWWQWLIKILLFGWIWY